MSTEPESSVWQLLDQAYRAVNRLMANHLAQAGHPAVRASHGAVFENLSPNGSRITDMADLAGITKQSMSEFVQELEEESYVERRPDPTDGRAQLVRLTPRGRKAVSAAFDGIARLNSATEDHMGKGQLKNLHRALSRLVDALATQEASR